jgi:hypothetical protein
MRRLAPALVLLAACGGSTENHAVDPIPLDDWRTEIIDLPPEFAPGLPPGKEVLLFAPGMFEAGAEDHWSYVFLMRVERGGLGLDEVSAFFEEYYDGLIAAVGSDRGLDLPDDPSTARFEERKNGEYVGTVDLVDAFGDGAQVRLNVVVRKIDLSPERTVLRVLASPQPRDHELWGGLEYALRTLEL